MTCTHVLGLIDAGPFADYPDEHLDRAWEHARSCATCGPALLEADRLSVELQMLARPEPPPGLAEIVMARIARVDVEAASQPVQAAVVASAVSGGFAWATLVGGFVAGVLIVSAMWPVAVVPFGGGMTADMFSWPAITTTGGAIGVSLTLYLAGLFAPLAIRERS